MGFPWAWLALAGRKAIPRLLARFRDFERPEHAPRSPAGTQTCAVVYRRPPCVPRSRDREKRPTAGRENFCIPQKRCIWFVHTPGIISYWQQHIISPWLSPACARPRGRLVIWGIKRVLLLLARYYVTLHLCRKSDLHNIISHVEATMSAIRDW